MLIDSLLDRRSARVIEDTATRLMLSLPLALIARVRNSPFHENEVVQSSNECASCMEHDKHP